MAKVVSAGFTDTSIPENPTLTRGKLNFTEDFRLASEKPGETRIVNMTSPNDRPERVKITSTEIADVFKNSGISEAYKPPTAKGVNVYVNLQDIYEVTDSVDATFVQHLPLGCSILLTCPQSQYITADQVQTTLARAVSCLYDQGATTTTRLTALLKGSTRPKEL